MSMLEDVHRLIDECNKDLEMAGYQVYRIPELAKYVIRIGLESIQSRRRRENRREIKKEIRPQFQKGKVTGAVEFTKETRRRLAEVIDRVYGPEGWMIGQVNISEFTRPMLLAQALKDRQSAKGSMVNVRLYEAFANGLPNDETKVGDFWTAKQFIKEKRRVEREAEPLEIHLG